MALNINQKHNLYVLADDGADAAVIEFNEDRQTLNKIGDVHLPDAQNPVRFALTGCSTVTRGAVTPREPITPIFRGVFELSAGVFATVWGYNNENNYIVDQPISLSGLTRNRLVAGLSSQQDQLPVLFAAGDIEAAFIIFTEGETITWELQPQSSGGTATTDYTLEVDPTLLTTLSAFVVRQHTPDFLRYQSLDVLTITKVFDQRLGKVTLNNAGLGFDDITIVRHTEEFNDDIPGQSAWYGRDTACRMEGGALQAHAKAGRASRILSPELGRELARGLLFGIPFFNITLFPIIQLPDAVAQQDEEMGFEIGNSGDGSIVALSAEQYTDGAFTDLGRVIVWKRDAGASTATNIAILNPPAGWTPANSMRFGRFTEVNPAGNLIFITGKKGPGIAVFGIDEFDNVTFLRNLTWAGYTARPDGEKGHEARFSEDGNTFILSTGAFNPGSATVPAEVFVLQTTDDWVTFTVVQTLTRPLGAGAPDVMTTLDTSNDASVLGIANWATNEVYVFRTDDNWANFVSYTLPNPSEYAFGVNDGSALGVIMAVSGDGFRVFAGAPGGDVDYGSGVQTDVGSVEMYTYEAGTPTYIRQGRVTPPEAIPNGAAFATVRFNWPGNRCSIIAAGIPKQFLYGISGSLIEVIAEITDAFVGGSSDTRWAIDQDTMIVANKLEDGDVKTDIGAFRYLDFAEEP